MTTHGQKLTNASGSFLLFKNASDMQLTSADTLVKEGTFLYDGQIVCDLRIVHCSVSFGSGDHEDPPEVCNDVAQDTFYVWYGSTTARGDFNTGGGGFSSLSEAMAHVESLPGIGKTVSWNGSMPTTATF